MPELAYLAAALAMFGHSIRRRPSQSQSHRTMLALAGVGVAAAAAGLYQQGELFMGVYRVDMFSQVFKLILAVAVFLVVVICRGLAGVEQRYHAEFYMFMATCTLGMMLMVSAMELITLYVALELSSFSLYILVPLRRGDELDVEAGIKYLFIGVAASCIMLFGMSYVYGACHTTWLADIMAELPLIIHQPAAAVGLFLTLAGFFFKLAVFPFHFWAPDVYQGASNQVAAFIATASKAAAVALLIRLTALTSGTSLYLVDVLIVLCVASMTLGNLVAIVQKGLKRMLAYSSVAHAGYVLMGILTMTDMGYRAAVFYAAAYMIMNFSAFLVVVTVAQQGQNLNISDLAGLHRRSPLLALTLMMALFSLAGIPPTVGFTGKFLVFAGAMAQDMFWLVLLGMINATVSLYYYLMVLKAAYLAEPAFEPTPLHLNWPVKALSLGLIAAMVYLGIYPQQVLSLAGQAVNALGGGG
jgi:NADH-quinone oxidoreductase subunit N